MSKIKIRITGIGAELTLGNYMPRDATIFNDWQEFFHFDDLIHETQLLAEHVAEIEIRQDDVVVFTGKIPDTKFQSQKVILPCWFRKLCIFAPNVRNRLYINVSLKWMILIKISCFSKRRTMIYSLRLENRLSHRCFMIISHFHWNG